METLRSCYISNGTGQETLNTTTGNYENCTVTSCHAGYHQEGNSCISNTKNCESLPTHATAGTQTWNGSGWGACQVNACEHGYHLRDNACHPSTRQATCEGTLPNNAQWKSGTNPVSQNYDIATDTWTPALPTSPVYDGNTCGFTCHANYTWIASANECLADTRYCSITNGTGEATLDPATGNYTCQVKTCNSGYHKNPTQEQCDPDVIACTLPDGSGSGNQSWDQYTNTYGACIATTCQPGYTLTTSGQCIVNTLPCSEGNGHGIKHAQSNGSYGACILNRCDTGYDLDTATNTCKPRPNNCAAGSHNGYSYGALNHGASQSVTKTQNGTPANGSTNYTATATCDNGTLNISGESSTFTCHANYHKEGNSCISNTRQATCGGTLPANAKWKTNDKYTQTYNTSNNTWAPTGFTAVYNAAQCGFVCNDHYTWNGSACVSSVLPAPSCDTITPAQL